MKTQRSLSCFSERNRLYVELLRGGDPEARDAALAETAGRMDDELAAEVLSLLADSGDADFRLRLLENLGFELEAGPVDDADDDPKGSVLAFEEPEGGPLQIGFPPSPSAERKAGGRGPEIAGGLSRRVYGELRFFLRAFFEDGRESGRLRRKALEVAVLAPEPWHEAAVRECWERTEPEWKVTALFCMGHLHPVDFTEEIDQGLAAGESALRSQAIVAADSRGLRALGPRIQRLAAERGHDLEVRLCAIEALATLRPPGAAALLAKLRAEPAPFGPFAAGTLLCLEQNERAEALLEDWKEGEPGVLPPAPARSPWPAPRLLDSRFL